MACDNKSPLPILRSPSHESINTNLSLFSVSSIELKHARLARGPSPNPSENKVLIQEPPPSFFEEDLDLLKTCARLSSALGLRKSFSCGELSEHGGSTTELCLRPRNAVSEMLLCCQRQLELANTNSRLRNISRSCSTWVAIGDVQGGSQLPSPHNTPASANFTPADLVRSVNKRVRHHYLQRRLLATCRALERMSRSDCELDRVETLVAGGNTLKVPGTEVVRRKSKNLPLTIRDIEKEKGKPLSKYERNVMIFNWLHTLEDAGLDPLQ